MPFAKRGDVVHSEATSGFNNQKKSLLINGLAALGDSLHPLHFLLASLLPGDRPSQISSSARYMPPKNTSGRRGVHSKATTSETNMR